MTHRRSAAPALLAAALLLVSGAARVHAQSSTGGSAPGGAASGGATRTGAPAARLTATLDAGAASVAFDDYLRTDAITLMPAGRLDFARGSVLARGAVSQFRGGNRSWQGLLSGSWLQSFSDRFSAEFGASGSSTYYDGVEEGSLAAGRAGSLLGEARLHATGRGMGAWLGLTGGATADDYERQALVQGQAAAWRQFGGTTVVAQLRPSRVGRVDFTDVELGARWWWRTRLELTGTIGARGGASLGGARTWQELGATWWIDPRMALVAGAGRYPVDVLNASPGARYATVALRLASRPPPRLEQAARPTRAVGAAPLALLRGLPAGDLSVRLTASGSVLVRLRAPEAGQVELMGDFTDWEPVPLARASDGMWERAFPLPPGTYRFNVRRDGGAWEVPTGVTGLPDDLGGEAGLLVVG